MSPPPGAFSISSPFLSLPSMKSGPVALCGVSLSLAVALYLVVRRSRVVLSVATPESSSATTTTTTTTLSPGGTTKKITHKVVTVTTKMNGTSSTQEVATYFSKDEAVEAARIASDQEFADGCSVKVHGHGVGKVLHYIPQSKSYKVEVHDGGKTHQKTVSAVHMSHVKVKDFFVYPIKSCKGIRLDHAEITARGIANDRNWMIVDTNGKFITQRRYSKLALIAPQLDDVENPTALTLTAPDVEPLRVPIVAEGQGKEVDTKVWESKMVGIDQGAAAAAWLNKVLDDVREGREFRLVYKKDSFKRATNPKYAPNHETVFADGYPFLLALDSSLADVNSHLKDKITMDRFRPNIVLTGAPAFADEAWNCVTIGGLRFRNVKPCDRCSMPTVNQETGEVHPEGEPRRSMLEYRTGADLGIEHGKKQAYYFGSNLVAEDLGRISVGAPVKILTIKDAVFA